MSRTDRQLFGRRWSYSRHHFPYTEGHIFMEGAEGACTLTLTPAASMTQEELDRVGKRIADAMNHRLRGVL